jgi:hypothetical protein
MAKRQIPNLQFNIAGGGEPDYSIISQNPIVRDIIYTNTFVSIKEAVKKRSKYAKICEINSSGQYLTVEQEDFKAALDNTLQYYEVLEEYEKCAEIVELKNKL